LWSPGHFHVDLREHNRATLVGSTEKWTIIEVLAPEAALALERERRARLLQNAIPEARKGVAAELVFAADQFVITPSGRFERQRARTQPAMKFAPSSRIPLVHRLGRDTMISLEGLTLVTGRSLEAGYILRTFADYVRDGLIPNMFPDREKGGLYHTADATLWFSMRWAVIWKERTIGRR